MATALKMEVSPETIIQTVKNMKPTARRAFLEDLIAATSPEYRNGSLASNFFHAIFIAHTGGFGLLGDVRRYKIDKNSGSWCCHSR